MSRCGYNILLRDVVINFMMQSTYEEANSLLAHNYILCRLWKLKIYNYVHKRPPLGPILSHLIQYMTSHPILLLVFC